MELLEKLFGTYCNEREKTKIVIMKAEQIKQWLFPG